MERFGTKVPAEVTDLRLLFESFPLYHWVVQFCVGITDLLLACEQLKPFRQTWYGPMPVREGRRCYEIEALLQVLLRDTVCQISIKIFLKKFRVCLTPYGGSPQWTIQGICRTRHAWQLRVSEKVYSTRYTQADSHPSKH